jgi:two-component system sensor histidine kinase PilS (NtrC family)
MKRGVEVVPFRMMWLVTLRMVLVTFILFLTAFMHLRGMRDYHPHQFRGLYIVAGAAYLETALAAFLHGRGMGRLFPAYGQLMIDNLLIAMIILVTDGVDSIFSVLFFFTAIAGSILYYRRGGLLITLQGSAVYLLAILVPFMRGIWPLLDLGGRYDQESVLSVLYRGTVNTTAFLMVSLLSSYLSESLRRARETLRARESDLAELQSLYQNIVRNIATGLITTDLNRRIISFNRAAEKICGQRAAECLDRDFLGIFRLPEGKNPYAYRWVAGEGGWRCEGGLRDYPSVILGMTFSPLRNEDGELAGIICSFQDLTKMRKMEEAVKRTDRLAAVGEMAAGVAHEIRNPLASISGSIQLLQGDMPADEQTNRLMGIVISETERLNRIITDFLLFATPRPPKWEAVDVRRLLEETVTLAAKHPEVTPGHRFDIAGSDRPVPVQGDPQMLRQAFWNLTINAVQAMPDGGALEIRVGRGEAPVGTEGKGEYVAIEFADSGLGVARENMDKLFAPFFSTKERGTGLGLSIVYKIVEQHQGVAEIEARPGGGTLVRILLPAGANSLPEGEG